MIWIPFISFFAIFAVIHSLLATRSIKTKIIGSIPWIRAWYRILYNLISLILLGIWVYLIPTENQLLYEIKAPLKFAFYFIQIASMICLIITIRTFDSASFLGLNQLRDRKSDHFELDEIGIEPLITKGIYKYIRHPLYTFSLGIFLFFPIMTERLLIMNILFLLYFSIGSYFEELRLIDKHGEDYVIYRKQAGRFLPKIFRKE